MRAIAPSMILALAVTGGAACADEKALSDFYARNKITIAVGFSPAAITIFMRAPSRGT